MRTKQEIINFLESKLGTKVRCVGSPSLDGQCVTLIKSLMDFLGVKDPYKARGHGKDAISSYLNEGIADKGLGFISVFSNKNMGGGYGHIWCNAGEGNGTYYESNGVKPLIVTKGKTYSYDKVCNFDRYIKQEQKEDNMNELLSYLEVENLQLAKEKLKSHLGEMNGKCGWGANKDMGYLGSERDRRAYFENLSVQLANEIDGYKGEINKLGYEVEELDKTNTKLEKDYNQMKAEVEYQNIKSTALQEDIEALNLEIKDLKKQAREKVCSLRESLLQFIDDIVERVKGAK